MAVVAMISDEVGGCGLGDGKVRYLRPYLNFNSLYMLKESNGIIFTAE
jgi:hypothetical protein